MIDSDELCQARSAQLRADLAQLTAVLTALPADSPGRQPVRRLVDEWSATIDRMRRDQDATRQAGIRRRVIVLRYGWLLVGLLAAGAAASGQLGGWASPSTGGLAFFAFAVALPVIGLQVAHHADTDAVVRGAVLDHGAGDDFGWPVTTSDHG